MTEQKPWDIESAKQHFSLDNWGLGHFDINTLGNVVVKNADKEIDLFALSYQLRDQGIHLPVLIRFPHLLQKSLNDLCSAFKQAINIEQYDGHYIPAYPIKVNQQAAVIHQFQEQTQWPIAFEVGSKAELIACLGISQQQQTIICNGYKDETYIRLALLGSLVGHEVIIVIESLKELKYVLKQTSLLGVQANLGMRVRLASIAKGNWQNTGGEYSKFGLTSNEVLELLDKLHTKNVLSWMKMLHFHMGSQISSLHDIESGMKEGMHYYAQLTELGVQFQQLNIGGGLAVDYEGSRSDSYFSMDYSIQDYADMVIRTAKQCCEQYALPFPDLVSENGRAMTAYHAVLLTDVVDVEGRFTDSGKECNALLLSESSNSDLKHLVEHIKLIKNILQSDSESSKLVDKMSQLETMIIKLNARFSRGELTLKNKAIAEKLVDYTYRKILQTQNDPLLQQLENKLIAKYFCNFSLFQSTPDIWGLRQIFPVLPVHRLSERPQIKSRIYDLTCDSDGRLDHYVEAGGVFSYLTLHEYDPDKDSEENYVLGIFLVGAYQEILGDMHNLFGDTNAVNIAINDDGSYQICDEEPGDSVEEILSYLHIDTHSMRQHWSEKLSRNQVSGVMRELVLNELEASLQSTSYLG